METVAIITAVKDVLLGGAATVTAIVAVVGLQNWRRELKGRTEFETAFRFIKSAYKLRDELHICRSPLIRMHEFPEGYFGSDTQNTAEENAQAWAYVYKNRWEPVWSAVQDFDAHTLESEALWGSDVKKRAEKLRACVAELNTSIDAIINDKQSGGEDFKSDPEFGQQMRSNVSATRKDDNALTKQISDAIESIEDAVRPHLKRS
jgi:hypothetical protein